MNVAGANVARSTLRVGGCRCCSRRQETPETPDAHSTPAVPVPEDVCVNLFIGRNAIIANAWKFVIVVPRMIGRKPRRLGVPPCSPHIKTFCNSRSSTTIRRRRIGLIPRSAESSTKEETPRGSSENPTLVSRTNRISLPRPCHCPRLERDRILNSQKCIHINVYAHRARFEL